MTYKQSPPFCIQVELVEGCNLRCSFCGLNGIRGKDNNFKFMTLDTAKVLAARIKSAGWNSRIEFAMHGEPSMNPDVIDILKVFRRILKKNSLMMTSNGGGFLKNPTWKIDKAMEYLNTLAFDDYDGINIIKRITDKYEGEHEFQYYPKNKDANPHRRRSDKLVVVIKDIEEASTGTHASINNHCGAGAPLNDNAQGKRCAKPFRELSVRWDGQVSLCCNDWRGVYNCGSVLTVVDLDELWNGPEFSAARKKLYHGQRDFGPCKGCDALSYRPGLLPDQKGKEELPFPNKEDRKLIRKLSKEKPMTKPVLRPWEK